MTPKIGVDRGRNIGLRLPAALAAELRETARANGETVTALVERAIRRELKRIHSEGKGGRE